MYNTILFDLDGTLIDSAEGITNSVSFALERLGIPVKDPKSLTPFIGPPLKESFMNYHSLSEDDALKAIEYYREYFSEQGVYQNTLYQGIRELLEKLVSRGIPLAVATSKPTPFAERILENMELAPFFRVITGSNLDNTRTTKEEVIAHCLGELDDSAMRPLMIGDRHHDIEGARINGLDSAGVLYGYGTREELESAGVRYLHEDVPSLSQFLLMGEQVGVC